MVVVAAVVVRYLRWYHGIHRALSLYVAYVQYIFVLSLYRQENDDEDGDGLVSFIYKTCICVSKTDVTKIGASRKIERGKAENCKKVCEPNQTKAYCLQHTLL